MLLRIDDVLAIRPARVLIAGTSGSGKTTLAARVGQQLGLPHTEIDALFHGPSWTLRPTFLANVDAFSRQDRWVTEWQYSAVHDLLADRANLLLWLHLPRAQLMRQVILRTLRRRIRRHVLWNGNVEQPLATVLHDRDHIVRWAWRTHALSAQRLAALQARRPDLPIIRLTSHHQADD